MVDDGDEIRNLSGLTSQEAAQRLADEGANVLPGNTSPTWLSLVVRIVMEPMFLMLLIAGTIYLALGDKREALFLLSFVLVVIVITFVQERKTQRALASLRELSAPRALVIRDGVEVRILGRSVVRGDLLVLHEGDRVAADAIVLSGQVSVDESLLTGESVPVMKFPAINNVESIVASGENITSTLFASTVVTKGVALARVQFVGRATAIGRIGEALATTTESQSLLQHSSRRLIRHLTMIGLALAVMQVLLSWMWNHYGFLESLLSGIALSMAVLPEEIPLVLTVFLALGAWRLSTKRVLTRRIAAVEALGTITVLAVDKTGTLTQNRMQVEALSVDDLLFSSSHDAQLPEVFHSLVEFSMLATPLDPFDPMEKAIQQFGHHWLVGTEHLHDTSHESFSYPLSSDILAMTRVFSEQRPQCYVLATKGSPEAVIDLCHLPDREREIIQQRVEAMAAKGLRVLAVAQGHWQGDAWPVSQHEFDFTFLGLIGLMDPPRPDVMTAIAECRQAGVRVVMMTGDHPTTARAIAQQVGLSERDDIITGSELNQLSDAALRVRLRHVDICARLQPEQKLRLVQCLQADGEVVAMTGDGVNDAPALKAADVGIAMGERGTDVAREAAALVLLDDSFASIVTAMRQGRRIYDNIANATRFIFAVHVVIIALAIVPSVLHWPMLLLPVHIVLLQLIIDPTCSIVFEAEKGAYNLMSRPPRARDTSPFAANQLGYAVFQGLGVAAVLLFGYWFWLADSHVEVGQARFTLFTGLVLGIALLIVANRDVSRSLYQNVIIRNPWMGWMFIMIAFLLILTIVMPYLRDMMGFSWAGNGQLISALALVMGIALWLEGIRWIKKQACNFRQGF